MSWTSPGKETQAPKPLVPPENLRRAKALLHRLGLRPRKGLGQHFLVDTAVLGRMVAAADLSSQDTVIEVGPGLGILTQELARRAGRVIAVEVDPKLVAFLAETLAGYANVAVVQADILKVDPSELLGNEEQEAGKGEGPRLSTLDPRPYKVVADLPYYITSPVLRHFLEARAKPGLVVAMVQREVAQRLTARPGKMSLLSVGFQLYGHPSMMAHVSPRSFYPAPKVHSAIIRIQVYERPAVEVDRESFFRVVHAGFGQPRKQLRNALAAGLGIAPGEAQALLERAAIDHRRRAQTLSLEEWAALTRVVGDIGWDRQPQSLTP